MFKEQFKYFKSKTSPPSLTDILNFDDVCSIDNKVKTVSPNFQENIWGLKALSEWKIYELLENPGLIFIRNPFTNVAQRYWAVKCLRDYTKKPNKSNIDNNDNVLENFEWWQLSQFNIDSKIAKKLRWITLGYHHNWNTKIYSDDFKNDFPTDLAYLCNFVAKILCYDKFLPQAAIINYYHMNSTLSGHTDHSEQDLEAPLFSFSFGQSAIFLLGGTSIDIKPTALYLHSGDIVVMSKQSRLCYHGIPRIIPNHFEVWNKVDWENINNWEKESMNDGKIDVDTIIDCKNEYFWKPYDMYLQKSRINVNVRQVLKSEQKSLTL